MKKTRLHISIPGLEHSKGRGVGFYGQFLAQYLEKSGKIKISDNNPDLIHYPFFDLFYPTLPLIKEKPTVVTIHDLTPLVMPARYPKGIKGTLNLFRQRLSLTNVSAIITDSENSKKDITEIFHFSPEKIFVTPLAVDPLYSQTPTDKKIKETKERFQLPDKFVLCVAGGPNPNKNLPMLAQVTDELKIPLVLVGKGLLQDVTKPVHPELVDLIDIKSHQHIIFPGFVSSEDLLCFYHLASVYCQPSLYEGFGLPLLEAMTAGCLIVSSNTSSLPEIYHHEAITFSPKSANQMKKALLSALSLTTAEKKKQVSLGQEKSKSFDWEITAKKTIEVYKIVLCQ